MLRALRWLLVFVLPVVGFLSGLALTPGHQPLWQATFPRQMVYLGQIDDGQTVLLVQQHNSRFSNMQLDLIGVDTRTGEQRFNLQLPEALSSDSGVSPNGFHLSPDGQTLLFLNEVGRSIHWYDWKKQKLIRQTTYETKDPYLRLNGIAAHGNIVAAYGYTNDVNNTSKAFIMCWEAATGKLLHDIPVGPQADDLHLSDDGKVASIVCGTTGSYSVAIIDTVQGKVLQHLPDYVHDIRWSPDSKRMSLLKAGVNNLVETLVREGETYQSVSEHFATPPGIIPTHASPNFAIARYTRYHPWRRWLSDKLSMEAGRWLAQVWPGMVILSVCDPESGKTLRSLTLPESKFNTRFYPSPDLAGVFVPHDYTLSYWSFDGATTWPKWLGLLLGVALAATLAVRNVSIPRRQAAPSVTT